MKLIYPSKKLKEVILSGAEKLKKSYIDLPHVEAKIIGQHILKMNDIQLIINEDLALTEEQIYLFNKAIESRCTNMPLQYIVQHKYFWKHKIIIKKKVLIPRPETELLIEKAIEIYKFKKNITLLELGVGSGCIFLSLINELNISKAIGIDISRCAIQNTMINLNANNIKNNNIRLIMSPWCSVRFNSKFDLIVSNPPYIPNHEMQFLNKNVKNYEPWSALSGKGSGITSIIEILKISSNILKPNGFLLLETNHTHDLRKISMKYNMRTVNIQKDLSNKNRIAIMQKLKQ